MPERSIGAAGRGEGKGKEEEREGRSGELKGMGPRRIGGGE